MNDFGQVQQERIQKMGKIVKANRETFNEMVNRVRAIAYYDHHKGLRKSKEREMSPWERHAYYLVIKQWSLKCEFQELEKKFNEAVENGDDF